jgi:hypothetical protein
MHLLKIVFFTSLLGLAAIISSCNKGPRKFVAQDAEKGVVQIFTANEKDFGWGSGFYIGNGKIVTNHHVVDMPNRNFLVVGRKNAKDSIELRDATVMWADKELDIAILQVPEIKSERLTLANAPIKKGSRAYAIGFPASASLPKENLDEFVALLLSERRGVIKNLASSLVQILDPTVNSGEIRKITRRKWMPNHAITLSVIDHDVNIGHGNSGGPLLDECGRVIGINTAVKDLTLADNVKLSSSIHELIDILEQEKIPAQISNTSAEALLSTGPGLIAWLMFLCVIALGIYILVTLRNKPPSETLTQYAGRVSGYTKLQRSNQNTHPARPHNGPRWGEGKIVSGHHAQQATPPPVPAAHTKNHSWVLQSESNSPHHVQLPISEEFLQRYGNNLVIGRKQGVAHLVINNSSISKSHAILSFRKGNFAIIDQKSANGTSINGTTLNSEQRTRINPGDKLTLGEVTINFSQLS